jgi:hypothetical protein
MEELLLIDNILLKCMLKLIVFVVVKESFIIPHRTARRADGYC